MKNLPAIRTRSSTCNRRERGRVQIIVLLGVVLVAGFVSGVYWQHRKAAVVAVPGDETGDPAGLSEGTVKLLAGLAVPVEVRFHALFSSNESSKDARGFAGRVNRLLAEFQRASEGKISVKRYDAWTEAGTRSATVDGVVPQNLDKGEPFYLGVAVTAATRRETLPQLRPEWEAALEFDLARTIARVAARPPAPPQSDADAAQAVSAADAVKRALPNLATLSLEEGKRQLRGAALQEFKAAVAEMERDVQQAQQRILEAESGGAESDRQAALKELQQVQARHNEKLRQLAARSQAQMEALERLKNE